MAKAAADKAMKAVADRAMKAAADGSENSGRQLATALTRDNIPVLVREISCQLRPINPEVHAPLVPGKICDVAYFVRCEVLGST